MDQYPKSRFMVVVSQPVCEVVNKNSSLDLRWVRSALDMLKQEVEKVDSSDERLAQAGALGGLTVS